MLNFDYIKIYGFGSLIGPIESKFDDNGLTLVKGLNGAGKTTLFSALTWVCYGSMLKEKAKPTTWEHIRPDDYKGVKVEVGFHTEDHAIHIIRCDGYKSKVDGSKGGKRLILKIDGDTQRNLGDKITTQKAINKLLGMSYDLFVNSIVFGQKMKRIIDATGPKQKGIFDEAFEVNYVNVAKTAVDTDYKQCREDYAVLTGDISNISTKISSTKELYTNSLDSEERFEILKLESLNKAVLRLEDEKNLVKSLKKQLLGLLFKGAAKEKFINEWDYEGWEKADDNWQVSKSAIVLKNTAIQLIDNNIKALAKQILKHPKNCDKCGQSLDKAKRKQLLQGLKKERDRDKVKMNTLEMEKSGLIDDRDFKKGELDAFNLGKKDYDKAESDLRFIKNQIHNIEREIADRKEDVKRLRIAVKEEKAKELTIKSTGYKAELKKLRLKMKPIKKALKTNSKQLELLDWLIKDPLSNSGLKTYIFYSMLGAVNDELYKYATVLGFEVEFAINLESKRKEFYSLVAKDGQIVPFNDLSGGQQQLVNIAIAFAIHAVVNKNNNVNILIMDEVFESLDAVNIDIVNELIQMKADSKAIYLITHQKDFNPRNCSTLHFELSTTGATRIV